MKVSNLFIPILLIGNINNLIYLVNKPVGVQAQLINCSSASNKTDCSCRSCYASAGVLGVASCCDAYITCINEAEYTLNQTTCQSIYYTCVNNCASLNNVSCSSSFAKACARDL